MPLTSVAELLDPLASASIHVLPVVGGLEDGESPDEILFDGSYLEFVDALGVLGVKHVFIATERLTAEDFLHEDTSPPESDGISGDDDEAADEAPVTIDLSSLDPRLLEYRTHIGRESGSLLFATSDRVRLSFLWRPSWWAGFDEARVGAIEVFEDDREAAHRKAEKSRRVQTKELLEKLADLMRDKDFCRLPTQKAMLAFALDRIPELEDVDLQTVKLTIQHMNARIIARKKGS